MVVEYICLTILSIVVRDENSLSTVKLQRILYFITCPLLFGVVLFIYLAGAVYQGKVVLDGGKW